jgi:hypothetical protein
VEQHKGEAVVVIVNAIEGDLKLHLVTLVPATWRLACNSGAVDVSSWHNLRLCLDCGRSELAVELKRTVCDVGEFLAIEEHISASS